MMNAPVSRVAVDAGPARIGKEFGDGGPPERGVASPVAASGQVQANSTLGEAEREGGGRTFPFLSEGQFRSTKDKEIPQ
jgi:hypothetical protein